MRPSETKGKPGYGRPLLRYGVQLLGLALGIGPRELGLDLNLAVMKEVREKLEI